MHVDLDQSRECVLIIHANVDTAETEEGIVSRSDAKDHVVFVAEEERLDAKENVFNCHADVDTIVIGEEIVNVLVVTEERDLACCVQEVPLQEEENVLTSHVQEE